MFRKVVFMNELFNLKHARQLAGVEIEELAACLGLTPRCIRFWESGQRSPSASQLPAIARALRLPVRQLFTEVSDSKEMAV